MPRRRAVLNDEAVPVPVRPAPDMSVLPYAAVRRMARHTWFHDPVFPFVHWPISGRVAPPEQTGDNAWRFWVTARVRKGGQTAPTIRLAAGLT